MEVIVLILIFSFLHSTSSSSLFKCCPPNSELHVSYAKTNSSDELVFGRDVVTCQPASAAGTLAAPSSAHFVVGLPSCRTLRLANAYERSPVACVDRVSPFHSVFGVACANSSEADANSTRPMPSVTSFRKCCPLGRKYDAERQFCWSALAANDTKTLSHLLKLAWRGRRTAFANATFGAPVCRRSEALLDTVVPAADLVFAADSVRINSTAVLLSLDEYCVDLVDDVFEYVVVRSCRDASVCRDRVCIRKCCPDGYEMQRRSCVPSIRPVSVRFYNETRAGAFVAVNGIRPAFLSGPTCKSGKYPLAEDDPEDSHVITLDGNVVMLAQNVVYGVDQYCVDNLYQKERTATMVCFKEWTGPFAKPQLKVVLTTVCAAVSAVLLFVTFLIYAILPSLQNQHSRLIMCYLITSAFSYVALVFMRVWPDWKRSPQICTLSGYIMLFTFLSSFSWLNIISYDIWSTFRAVRSSFLKKSKTSKRFSFYCLYGWGLSAAWTMFAAYCQLTSVGDTSSFWKPDIGDISCWFSDYAASKVPFFIVPAALMIVFNVFLFVVTVKYCASIKEELKITHSNIYSLKRYTADMNEFMINVKLFILMGLNWTMELISLTVQPHNRAFFIFSDILNALQGTIIFCLFVMKRKVLRDMKKTFCGSNPKTGGIERATGYTASTTSSIIQSLMNSRRSVNIFP